MKITKVKAEGRLKMRDAESFWYDIRLHGGGAFDPGSSRDGWLFDFIRNEANLNITDLLQRGIKVKIVVEILDEDS